MKQLSKLCVVRIGLTQHDNYNTVYTDTYRQIHTDTDRDAEIQTHTLLEYKAHRDAD